MKLIGITGGVGAGKTMVLGLLKELCRCRVLLADEVGNEVKLPGQPCYERLVQLLGRQVLAEDGTIDKKKMAGLIFSDPALLDRVNGIIHPEVKRYILEQVDEERRKGEADYFSWKRRFSSNAVMRRYWTSCGTSMPMGLCAWPA